jgi:hypothetical protein
MSETIVEQLLIVTVIIDVKLHFLDLEECRVTRLLHHSQICGDRSYTSKVLKKYVSCLDLKLKFFVKR